MADFFMQSFCCNLSSQSGKETHNVLKYLKFVPVHSFIYNFWMIVLGELWPQMIVLGEQAKGSYFEFPTKKLPRARSIEGGHGNGCIIWHHNHYFLLLFVSPRPPIFCISCPSDMAWITELDEIQHLACMHSCRYIHHIAAYISISSIHLHNL